MKAHHDAGPSSSTSDGSPAGQQHLGSSAKKSGRSKLLTLLELQSQRHRGRRLKSRQLEATLRTASLQSDADRGAMVYVRDRDQGRRGGEVLRSSSPVDDPFHLREGSSHRDEQEPSLGATMGRTTKDLISTLHEIGTSVAGKVVLPGVDVEDELHSRKTRKKVVDEDKMSYIKIVDENEKDTRHRNNRKGDDFDPKELAAVELEKEEEDEDADQDKEEGEHDEEDEDQDKEEHEDQGVDEDQHEQGEANDREDKIPHNNEKGDEDAEREHHHEKEVADHHGKKKADSEVAHKEDKLHKEDEDENKEPHKDHDKEEDDEPEKHHHHHHHHHDIATDIKENKDKERTQKKSNSPDEDKEKAAHAALEQMSLGEWKFDAQCLRVGEYLPIWPVRSVNQTAMWPPTVHCPSNFLASASDPQGEGSKDLLVQKKEKAEGEEEKERATATNKTQFDDGRPTPNQTEWNYDEFQGMKVSIVIPTKYEQDYIVKTLRLIYATTPMSLLEEIIIVDDKSPVPVQPLLEEAAKIKGGMLRDLTATQLASIKVLRNEHHQGLIRAKIQGAEMSKGSHIFFLDGHCEPFRFWLEPLLHRAKPSYKRVVVPLVGNINATAEKLHDWTPVDKSGGAKMMFDWTFEFHWFDDKENDDVPILSGGLLLLSRRWWDEVGGYDDGMVDWGGENIEQSMRCWMCGGEILVERRSIIGHIFERPANPTKVRKDGVQRNKARAAYVWLDQYWDSAFLPSQPGARNLDLGPGLLRQMLHRFVYRGQNKAEDLAIFRTGSTMAQDTTVFLDHGSASASSEIKKVQEDVPQEHVKEKQKKAGGHHEKGRKVGKHNDFQRFSHDPDEQSSSAKNEHHNDTEMKLQVDGKTHLHDEKPHSLVEAASISQRTEGASEHEHFLLEEKSREDHEQKTLHENPPPQQDSSTAHIRSLSEQLVKSIEGELDLLESHGKSQEMRKDSTHPSRRTQKQTVFLETEERGSASTGDSAEDDLPVVPAKTNVMIHFEDGTVLATGGKPLDGHGHHRRGELHEDGEHLHQSRASSSERSSSSLDTKNRHLLETGAKRMDTLVHVDSALAVVEKALSSSGAEQLESNSKSSRHKKTKSRSARSGTVIVRHVEGQEGRKDTEADTSLADIGTTSKSAATKEEDRSVQCTNFEWWKNRFNSVFETRGLLVSDAHHMRHTPSGLCLDVKDKGKDKTPLVLLNECNPGADTQKWSIIHNNTRVMNHKLDKCLDRGNDGARMAPILYACDFGHNSNQHWSFAGALWPPSQDLRRSRPYGDREFASMVYSDLYGHDAKCLGFPLTAPVDPKNTFAEVNRTDFNAFRGMEVGLHTCKKRKKSIASLHEIGRRVREKRASATIYEDLAAGKENRFYDEEYAFDVIW
ncbi:unnamed protein product [Amoebophrya sp. A25]|nr:unnamed protein product [Amoebophrya sp. A25]|eukprot:GSA25T00020721001.1